MKQMSKLNGVVLALSVGTMTGCSLSPALLATAPGSLGFTSSLGQGTTNTVRLDTSKLGPQTTFVPGEVVVKFRDVRNSKASLSRFGLTHKADIAGVGSFVTTTTADVLTTVKTLSADPTVLYAEPNYIARTSQGTTGAKAAPAVNDPDFGKQYAPQITQAPEGWAIAKADPTMVLAIVDTGIDPNHPDLKAKIQPGWDMVDGDNQPNDGNGHGTHCAGIAAAIANNGVGIAGIAPLNKIFSVRVLDDKGSGSYANVAGGIVKAVDLGAKVISMSLGGPSSAKVMDDAIAYAVAHDVLVVAAMGNDGGNVKSYPAVMPGVMAVGSTDEKDKRSSFSNFGDWISVSAPGSNIWSTLPTQGAELGKNYGSLSGTSMATPAVAGLAILVRNQFPAFTAKQVKAKIEASADDKGPKGFDKEFGFGRINVLKALQ